MPERKYVGAFGRVFWQMSRKRLFGGPNYYNEHENKKIYSRSWLTLNEKAQNLNLPAYDYLGGADALPYRAVHSWWQALLALCVGRWRITERKSASWPAKPTTRLLSFALINLRKSNKAKQIQGRAVLSDNAMYAEAVSQLVRSCVATDILWGFRVTRWLLHFVWCISRGSVPAPSLWNANCLCRVASENCHMAFRVCMAKPFYSTPLPHWAGWWRPLQRDGIIMVRLSAIALWLRRQDCNPWSRSVWLRSSLHNNWKLTKPLCYI